MDLRRALAKSVAAAVAKQGRGLTRTERRICQLEDREHRGPIVESAPHFTPYDTVAVDSCCAACGQVLVTVSYSLRGWQAELARQRRMAGKTEAA